MMTLDAHAALPLNRLLGHLKGEDLRHLAPDLETVKLAYKQSLYRANEPIEVIYFIENGVASLVNTMANGAAAEVATIGNEGMVGLPVLLGDSEAPTSVYMQVPGAGLRMRASSFRRALEHSGALRAVLLRYAHLLFNQVAQSAACAHFHALEQRCCRWLLMTHDRMASDEFLLTHEFLAMMLGVRRAGVTQAAGALQRAGLIQYRHGRIAILDREALEQRSCECYAVTKEEFDRLLGAAPTKADSVGNRPKRRVM
jgi:CRP-like cAMP-binding protein